MAGSQRSTARSIRTRKGVILGLAVSAALSASSTAVAGPGEQGHGGNCPMGAGGDGNTSDASSPTRSAGGVQPLRPAAPRPGATPSQGARPAQTTSRGIVQQAAVPQATTVASQGVAVAQPQAVATTAGSSASTYVVADAAAQARAARQVRQVRQARQLAAKRAAAARARARSERLRVRVAGAERWHAPARGSALPAEAPAAVAVVDEPARLPVVPLITLALLAGAAVALVRRRREPGAPAALVSEPPLRPLVTEACAVEAELQEIVAEGRASQLLADDETLVGR